MFNVILEKISIQTMHMMLLKTSSRSNMEISSNLKQQSMAQQFNHLHTLSNFLINK